jgi:translocation and assembly module TamB
MRFNSVLGAILFVILASSLALIVFIHTRSFGELLSRVVSDISERRANAQVTIHSVGFRLFPPGVELNRVAVSKDFGEGKKISAELGQLGFYIGLVELDEGRLTFGEIRISDSVIDYDADKKDEEDLKEIKQEIIDGIFNYSQHIPVRIDTILVQNTLVHLNHDLLEVKRLKLFKSGDNFVVRAHVSKIRPAKDLEFSIDEVWAEAEVGRRELAIHRLKLQHDVHSVVLKGKVANYRLLKGASASFGGEGLVYLKAFKGVDLAGPITISSGSAQVNFSLIYEKEKLNGEANLSVKDFRSSVAWADKLDAGLQLKNDNVALNWLELSYKEQKVRVRQPVKIADLKRKTYLTEKITGEVKNYAFSNAFRILGPALKPLQGNLNGKVTLLLERGDLFFIPENGFKVRDLALVVGNEKLLEILRIKEAKLTNAEFALVKGEFVMSSVVELANTKLEVDGEIGKKGAKFTIQDGKVDLTDFGDIAQIGVKGKGRLAMEVSGPLDNLDMNFKGKLDGFGVLGYQLGDSEVDLGIALKDSTVTIRRLDSTFGKTVLSGNGVINYGNLDIALGINSTSANYHDLSLIMKPIFSKITFLPSDFELNAKIDAYIHGKTKIENLKVKADVKFTDLVAYRESVNRGEFKVGLQNQIISINQFEGHKDKGMIEGDFSFVMPSERLSIDFRWNDLRVAGFNVAKRLGLNFDGYINGGIEGQGRVADYVLELKSDITDTNSQNHRFPDSHLLMKIMPERLSGEAQLLGPMIQTVFDYSMTSDRRSMIDVKIDVPELRPMAVALLGPHIDQEEFTGSLRFSTSMNFNRGLEHLDLKANLEELVFEHEGFKVDYRSPKAEFHVENNQIVKWNLDIKQADLFVTTKGSGTFGKEVSIINEFHVNSKLAEVLLAQVLSSEGYIRNIIRIDGKGKDYQMSFTSKSEGLNFSIEGAPFPFNDLKYTMDFSNNRLVIRELVTSMESGTASAKGDVYFEGETPDVNLKYQLERAEFLILGKSTMNASGEGIILGNDLPYNLSGEITINRAQLVNELTDFTGKSVAQVRFLPKNQESIFGKLFNLNLNVKADVPVRVTNSMMDVALKGEVRLTGNPIRPRGEGRLFSPTNSSRIFFKNSEYNITNADLNFSPKKEITNPDFDVSAMTLISSFKVTAKAYGDLERFNFDLTSDPALPRNSILSLIAFGYTDEIQAQLTQGQQQNLTQVGVGSFVFDRFKISDILNKQFGLQVNLGTVFEQSQNASMLTGRSQEGQGNVGRTRSATKIELKKRLDEALTLSVSSTMGGSIGQRQSMNLTYSLNKKVQLEGVYELRTNAEGEEDIIDNSIGGDVKFRWTFK